MLAFCQLVVSSTNQNFHILTHSLSLCQSMPAGASRCQPVPAGASRCQPVPAGAGRYQPVPASASQCQPVPASASWCRLLPASSSRCQQVSTLIPLLNLAPSKKMVGWQNGKLTKWPGITFVK